MSKSFSHYAAPLVIAVFAVAGFSFCIPHFGEAAHGHDARIGVNQHVDTDHCGDSIEAAVQGSSTHRALQDHQLLAILPANLTAPDLASTSLAFVKPSRIPPPTSAQDSLVMRC